MNTNKEIKKIYNKTYRLTHSEQIKIYNKVYYKASRLANKEKMKIRSKAYYLANKEKINKRTKVYRLVHKEEARIYGSTYRREHPEACRLYERKHRALKYGVSHESYTDIYVFERDNWICDICGQKINKRLKYPDPRSSSIDHIIPLSKGGSDNPLNLQAAHLRCNPGKNATNKGQLRLFG